MATRGTTRDNTVTKSNRGDNAQKASSANDEKCNEELKGGNITDDAATFEELKTFYEDYNLVVYGLPSFVATS